MMDKHSSLTSVSATREVLERHGLATKKSLGQHFLINDGVVGKICDLAELSSTDIVLEVGPGIGTLTLALLEKSAAVIAVERDEDLPTVLSDTLAAYQSRFALIEKDALNLTQEDIRNALDAIKVLSGGAVLSQTVGADSKHFFPRKFISNLPYAVAATIILDYFERFASLESATVMIQKEVADRICAVPGTKSYGAYTVKLSLFAKPTGQFTVKPTNFFPPPRVDSAVVRLERTEATDEQGVPLSGEALAGTLRMIEASFANRRKTILNSCKTFFEAQGKNSTAFETSGVLTQIFEQADIDPSIRGEALCREDFIRLGIAYSEITARITA